MNPQSAYYLSFNTGYPNAFDKALGRTGSQLMVHGDCSSRGCYAMTDEQIAEIYSLGRESFFGGQRAFQLQAYPFKMTPINMAKHRNNPNMPFWKMIKEGYDHFEVTRQEPKVDFCEKKYVFDAVKAPNATREPVFDASAKCPAYAIPDEIADAVREKQQQDAAETAKLIAKGTPVARINTGIDGGMNKVFAAKRARRQYRPLRRRRRPGPVAAVAVPRARHHPVPRQSAARRASDNLLLGAPESRQAGRSAAGTGGARADPGRQRGAGAQNPTASSPASPARSALAASPTPPPAQPPPPRQAEGGRGQDEPSPRRARGRRCRRRQACGNQTGRRQTGAEAFRNRRLSDRRRSTRARSRPGGRFGADRVVEFVRQPLRGGEVTSAHKSARAKRSLPTAFLDNFRNFGEHDANAPWPTCFSREATRSRVLAVAVLVLVSCWICGVRTTACTT